MNATFNSTIELQQGLLLEYANNTSTTGICTHAQKNAMNDRAGIR